MQKESLKISNSVTLDANDPIPYKFGSDAFARFGSAAYLPFFDGDDNFFNTLLEARLLSVTNNACISTKKDYTVGEGWFVKDIETKAVDQAFVDWAKSVNKKNETLNQVIAQIAGYYYTFGNVFVELVRGMAGGRAFLKVYVHSCLECRLGEPDDDDIVRTVVKSRRFKQRGMFMGNKEDLIEIPLYDPLRPKQSWKKDKGGVERTMIHLKHEVEGVDYYGMPSNVSSLPQQVLEYEQVRYDLDDLENNMNPGGVMILQGNVTQAEATKFGRAIIKQHVGKGKRGRWVVIASENGIENSKLEQFQTKKEGSFIESGKRVEEKIIFANQWDKLLAGLSDSGGLGKGNAYILNLFRLKYQTAIAPVQKYIVESFLNVVLAIADEWQKTKWSDYEFGLMTNTPINILDNESTIDTWTVDEVRAEAGLPPLGGDRGAMLVGDLKKQKQNVQDKPAQ